MSFLPLGVTALQAVALGLLKTVLIRPRSIGGILADVTIDERHSDELEITQHPVEQGAAITDHSFKRPASVTIRIGFSNSGKYGALLGPDYVEQCYTQLLNLQASREPFDIVTGKRVYRNMLIASLGVTTDETTEFSLMATVECQEVIIVETVTTTTPDPKVMKSPEATASTTNLGTKSLRPVIEIIDLPLSDIREPRLN